MASFRRAAVRAWSGANCFSASSKRSSNCLNPLFNPVINRPHSSPLRWSLEARVRSSSAFSRARRRSSLARTMSFSRRSSNSVSKVALRVFRARERMDQMPDPRQAMINADSTGIHNASQGMARMWECDRRWRRISTGGCWRCDKVRPAALPWKYPLHGIFERLSQRDIHADRSAPPQSGIDVYGAAEFGRAGVQVAGPHALPGGRRIETAPIVLHEDVQLSVDACDLDGKGGRTGMLERVAHHFLDDPVGGDLHVLRHPFLHPKEREFHIHFAGHVDRIAQIAER